MVNVVLFSFVLIQLASAAVVKPLNERQAPRQPPRPPIRQTSAKPFIARVTEWLGKGGRVDRPADAAPEREELSGPVRVTGAKRVKVRYGPYSVPSAQTKSLMGEAGMLWNYPDLNVKKPCDECVLLSQQAGLEYVNGTNANIDTGMWLHHMVHFVSGPTRWDPTCYGRVSLPHFNVMGRTASSERWFSSGNERTVIALDLKGDETRWGYHITRDDSFSFIVDLMNMNKDPKTVFITMTYDYLDGALPQGWQDVKPIWLDVNQCGTSEISSPQQKQFSIESRPWNPNFSGTIISTSGHVHDGGVDVQIMRSDSQICDSKTAYAESKEYVTGPQFMSTDMHNTEGGHGHGGNMKHISSMTSCAVAKQSDKETQAFPTNITLSPTQAWHIKANYDYDRHQGEQSDGRYEDIMGISLVFAAVEPGVRPLGPSNAITGWESASNIWGTVGGLAANAVGLGWLL